MTARPGIGPTILSTPSIFVRSATGRIPQAVSHPLRGSISGRIAKLVAQVPRPSLPGGRLRVCSLRVRATGHWEHLGYVGFHIAGRGSFHPIREVGEGLVVRLAAIWTGELH